MPILVPEGTVTSDCCPYIAIYETDTFFFIVSGVLVLPAWESHRGFVFAVGEYFPFTTFRRLIAHTRLTLSFLLHQGRLRRRPERFARRGESFGSRKWRIRERCLEYHRRRIATARLSNNAGPAQQRDRERDFARTYFSHLPRSAGRDCAYETEVHYW